jgi:predicted ATP-dependent endonuclease of OLD family
MSKIRISSVRFKNFKALKEYSVHFNELNVLVGPNNCGKSTIIGAFRILDTAIKKARSRSAQYFTLSSGLSSYAHNIPEESISIPLENVHTDYNDKESQIDFRLTNKNILTILFPIDGGCFLICKTPDSVISTPGKFKKEFPITIQAVPVLGPLEHNEMVVTENTVKNALNTHRASRHFRNYWRYFNEGWNDFAKIISESWPGIEINPPELTDLMDQKLTMFCSENRIEREVFWAGFGFQIWCQLLTHLSRSTEVSVVVIDEPEIYLHPDVQRQLVGILRELKAEIIIATHSVEIIGEAEPNEILLVDKNRKSAQRLKDVEGVQQAIEIVGSAQNVTLTHLARTKKIIFVEGLNDFKTIRRFSRHFGLIALSNGINLTPFESGRFSSWKKVKSLSWGLSKTLDADISIGAIYDRDYNCSDQITEIKNELDKNLVYSHIHSRKEIENYLLVPSVLNRVLDNAIAERKSRTDIQISKTTTIGDLLVEITEGIKSKIQGQYIARRTEYLESKGTKIDSADITTATINNFEKRWKNLDSRLEIVPGKEVLRQLREKVQQLYSVNLTDIKIIDEFQFDEIPPDLKNLIINPENYRINQA